eukprot:3933841-Rhodomonas_salina.1
MAFVSLVLRGCGGGLRCTGRILADGSKEWTMGCTPDDCRGGCDKDRIAVCWKGYWRFNSPPFGVKVAGCPLSILTSAFARRWRRKGIYMLIWIDDIICAYSCEQHASKSDIDNLLEECGGLQSCCICQRNFIKATELQQQIKQELHDLGWQTNEKSSGDPDYAGLFTGLSFDTYARIFFVTVERAEKLRAEFRDLLDAPTNSAREASKVRGKLVWHSCALDHVRIFCRAINNFIGLAQSDQDSEIWDLQRPKPPLYQKALQFWVNRLPELAQRARPIWKFSPQQLYNMWLKGVPWIAG